MALWLIRAGKEGEFEQRFLDKGRIYFNWSGLNANLADYPELGDLYALFESIYADASQGTTHNWARQAGQFSRWMKIGDWVALPSKFNPVIHFGKITGGYIFDENAEDRFQHHHTVEWFAPDIPRDRFDQDILYSFGAFLTVCQIQRNNAEERVKEMAANGWHVPKTSTATIEPAAQAEETEARSPIDLETTAKDQISKLMLAKFKGQGLAALVKALLEAQGYTVFMPPEGPDKGVDLLAAPGTLGFGSPRICVQVKATDAPVDRPVLDQLIGVMQNFHAQQGLLVSWSGFKQSVEKERGAQFFRVRLWNREDILNGIFAHYDQLPAEIRAEIPLKQIWTLNLPVEES